MGLAVEERRFLGKAGAAVETPFGEGNLGQPLSSVPLPMIRDLSIIFFTFLVKIILLKVPEIILLWG